MTNSISYTYNLDSSVASLTSPNGHTYTYSYSNALRPVSLSDSGHGITYVANAHYAAPGELTSAQHGLGLAITETNQFNSRLEPTILSAASSAMTDFSLSYSWVLPNGKNNASVYRIQNNRDNTRSLQYSYDQMNRLATTGTYNATTWGDAYVYDNWGNLLQKNPTQGTGEPLQVTTDAHNHINTSGFKYDAAGNLTWDGANALKFDAENHMNPATGYVYSYDGDDLRVEKNYQGSITYYWYDDNANVISTTGVATNDYVYFAGRRIAFEDSAGNQHYYWSDHLGSAGVLTNSNGSAIQWEADYYPFGTKRVITNNLTNYYLFTGYQFDYETGYNYATFREQSPNLGRFMSPDPLGLAAANVSNPQSLNTYSFVMNNPTNDIDPLGLVCTGDPPNVTCNNVSGVGREGGFGGAGSGGFGFSDIPVYGWGMLPDGESYDFGLLGNGLFIGSIEGVDGNNSANSRKLTPAQCQAARTVLAREARSGTTVAAWQSAIGFGDGTMQPFNSSVPGQAYTETAAGLVKVDWFTDLRLTTLIPGPQLPAYIAGKLTWTGLRLANSAPITNALPFQDPVETHTFSLAVGGAGFRTLFTPDFMKENCPQ